jgi:hypothetical protein
MAAEHLFEYVPQTTHGGRPFGLKAKVLRLPNRDIVLEYEDGSKEVLSAASWCLAGPGVEQALPWWQAAVDGLVALTARPEGDVVRDLRDLVYKLQVDAGPAKYNKPFSLRRSLEDTLIESATLVFRTMAYFTELKKWQK